MKPQRLCPPYLYFNSRQYYSATAAAKVTGVVQYMKELLEGGCKFILFAHHKVMLSGVREFLQKDSIPHILIDGNTAAEKR